MNSVTCQASLSRHSPSSRKPLRFATFLVLRTCGSQISPTTPAGTAQFFSSVGFPGFLAYPVIAFEVIGGIFLILGIVPRWVAAVAAVQLLFASSVHWGNGWAFAAPNGGGWEYPVFLAVAAAALALLGDGAYALRPSTGRRG